MENKMIDKRITTLEMIASDMKNDAKHFEGKPFDGKHVAQYLGNLGAAVAALANILKQEILDGE